MSAGDKDRSGFHRVGGSLTQNRSRDSNQEHEHCTPNMSTDLPGSSANPPTSSASAGSGHGRSGFCSLRAAERAVVMASAATQSWRMEFFEHRDCFVALRLLVMTTR